MSEATRSVQPPVSEVAVELAPMDVMAVRIGRLIRDRTGRIIADQGLYQTVADFLLGFGYEDTDSKRFKQAVYQFAGAVQYARASVGNQGLRVVEVPRYDPDAPGTLDGIRQHLFSKTTPVDGCIWPWFNEGNACQFPSSAIVRDDRMVSDLLSPRQLSQGWPTLASHLKALRESCDLKEQDVLTLLLLAMVHAVCSGHCPLTAVPGLVIVAERPKGGTGTLETPTGSNARCSRGTYSTALGVVKLLDDTGSDLYLRDYRLAIIALVSLGLVGGSAAFVFEYSTETGVAFVLQVMEAVSHVIFILSVAGLTVLNNVFSLVDAVKCRRQVLQIRDLAPESRQALLAREMDSAAQSVLNSSCSYKRARGEGGLDCSGLAKVSDLKKHGFVVMQGWAYDYESKVLKRMAVDSQAKLTIAESDPSAWEDIAYARECTDGNVLDKPMA